MIRGNCQNLKINFVDFSKVSKTSRICHVYQEKRYFTNIDFVQLTHLHKIYHERESSRLANVKITQEKYQQFIVRFVYSHFSIFQSERSLS